MFIMMLSMLMISTRPAWKVILHIFIPVSWHQGTALVTASFFVLAFALHSSLLPLHYIHTSRFIFLPSISALISPLMFGLFCSMGFFFCIISSSCTFCYFFLDVPISVLSMCLFSHPSITVPLLYNVLYKCNIKTSVQPDWKNSRTNIRSTYS